MFSIEAVEKMNETSYVQYTQLSFVVSEVIKQIRCYAYIPKCLFSAIQISQIVFFLFVHTSLLFFFFTGSWALVSAFSFMIILQMVGLLGRVISSHHKAST
jgi:hypothetical protein